MLALGAGRGCWNNFLISSIDDIVFFLFFFFCLPVSGRRLDIF